MSKILTVDIGNSNIVAGVWEEGMLLEKCRFPTRKNYTEIDIENAFIQGFKGADVRDCRGAVLSSVVPEITNETLLALHSVTGKNALLISSDIDTGIDVSMYGTQGEEGPNPGKTTLGTDRIIDLAAASAIFHSAVMVCDLGTCTTITVMDDRARVVGGMICPGIQLSLDAEAERASQLPKLDAYELLGSLANGGAEANSPGLLGTDTSGNMLSGAVVGTAIMIDGLARRIAASDFYTEDYAGMKKTDRSHLQNLKLVITGGLGRLVMPWISFKADYEPDLLLRGLYEVYLRNLSDNRNNPPYHI